MTFYQELQLNQFGSKEVIRNSKTRKEKLYHIMVYLTKIVITVAFCFLFVTVYSLIFGNENSIVGVVVLLHVLVFKNAHFGIHVRESIWLLFLFFIIMAFGPHFANQLGPVIGVGINVLSLFMMIVFGCHIPQMFNQSTLVLSYLLLYGYDVSGIDYRMRILGLGVGCLITVVIFYRNHGREKYEYQIKTILKSFDIHSSRTRWQLCQVICVPLVVCVAELNHLPRAMWAGIAAMSTILPLMSDMKYRVHRRIIGNISGIFCFIALYFLLPPSIYAYIGIIGGIGVGFSVKYGWQAVFNTFGALAIATEIYGLKNAVGLRVFQNVFGVMFAFLFCISFNWLMDKTSMKKNLLNS